jgi:hypothetical protein
MSTDCIKMLSSMSGNLSEGITNSSKVKGLYNGRMVGMSCSEVCDEGLDELGVS